MQDNMNTSDTKSPSGDLGALLDGKFASEKIKAEIAQEASAFLTQSGR